MSPDHTAEFETRLIDVFELYDRHPPSEAVLRLWWNALERYPWNVVEQALFTHAASCKFAPKPADIIERLVTGDGRPSPDEAWSIAIQADDEGVTVVWTTEIAEAFAIAKPVLDAGDGIGARRTFLSAYERTVSVARNRLEPASWSVSLGHDPQLRRIAIEHAVDHGLLPPAQAKRWLPGLAHGDAVTSVGLLADNVHKLPDEQQRNARRFIAIVKAALAQADSGERVDRAAATAEREQRNIAERAKALDGIKALEQREGDRESALNRASHGPGAA